MDLELRPLAIPGIEDKRPLIIAGPCSAETEEQVISTAKELSSVGIRIFRAGLWKPRTKPGGFEGIGAQGLAWMNEALDRRPYYRQSLCSSGSGRCP